MQQFVVSRTRPGAFPEIHAALRVPVPPGTVRQLLVEPGWYAGFATGPDQHAVVTAVDGPGSVTVGPVAASPRAGSPTVTVQGGVTLQGLAVHSALGTSALVVGGGNVLAEDCAFVMDVAGAGEGFVSIHQTVQVAAGVPDLPPGSAAAAWETAGPVPSQAALRRCTVQGSGVAFLDGIGEVDDCDIHDVYDVGLSIGNGPVTVRRTRIRRTGQAGVFAGSPWGATATLTDCVVSDSASVGVRVEAGTRLTMTGCQVERPREQGISVSRGRAVQKVDGALTVADVSVTDAGKHGIELGSAAAGSFERVDVRGAHGAGVHVTSMRESTFTGGVVEHCGADGVVVGSGAQLTLAGVTVRDNAGAGVRVHGNVDRLVVRGGAVTGNGDGGVVGAEPDCLDGVEVRDNKGGDCVAAPAGATSPGETGPEYSTREAVGRALVELQTALAPFVDAAMTRANGPGWRAALGRADTSRGGYEQNMTDVRFLLKVVTEERAVFGRLLSGAEMAAASALRKVGNTYSHEFSDEAFSLAASDRALKQTGVLIDAVTVPWRRR